MSSLDVARPLTTSPGLRRRRIVDKLMRGGAAGAAVLAVGVLVLVIYTVVRHGAPLLSLSFITKNAPSTLGGSGGGIANALIGSALIVAMATALALPVGVLIAIYLTEFSTPRTARPIRLALDLLNGTPTVVIGLFVFGLLVAGSGQTGFAASFSLAIIMLPLIARTTQEMLLLVPREHRDGAHALGVSRWRTIVGIVLPGSLGGILTGVVLAISRAAGETAPLIFVCFAFNPTVTSVNIFGQAIPNIPVDIFEWAESPFPADQARAWGAALVLMALILLGNLSARAMLARQRRKLTR